MGNKYTTATLVLGEIPGTVPDSLDTGKIDQYIEDASRYVDSRLPNYAVFPDIGASPATPPVIEKIARLIAAHDCLVFMGILRGEDSSGSELRDMAEAMLDKLHAGVGETARALIDPGEYDYSTTPPREEARKADSSRPGAFYHSGISRRDYRGEDVEDR